MIGSMVLVPLPEDLPYSLTEQERLRLQEDLAKKFNIISCVSFSSHDRHYVRISASIYNELSDYKKLARAINMMEGKKHPGIL